MAAFIRLRGFGGDAEVGVCLYHKNGSKNM